MTEAAHHPWGASSLKQKINCLASDQATRGLPDTDSEHSLLGTAAHELAEVCNERDEPAKAHLGKTIDVRRVDGTFAHFLVDQPMVDAVQFFLDHCNALPGVDFNEQRVRYDEYVPGAFCTLDRARGNDVITYVRDYKHGTGVRVFAKDNEQLLGQALGFYLTWGHLFDVDYFDLGVVQPRIDHVDTWRVSLADVLKWAEEVLAPAYVRAQQPNPPYQPGEWCQFCKIKGTCKARAMSAFETAVGEFEDLDDAIDKAGELAPVVGVLTNEQIAKILPSVAGMKKWIKDIEKYAFAETAQGRFPWKKIVGGRGTRVLKPGSEIEFELADIPDEKLYEPREFKSVAQLEKVLGKKAFAPATEKKEAGPFAHLVEKRPGKPTLADIDDLREAITLSATDGFDDVDDE
jgi:uncharacterized protein DUF2800